MRGGGGGGGDGGTHPRTHNIPYAVLRDGFARVE